MNHLHGAAEPLGVDGVVVILSHYRRPENLPRCINAWRRQSAAPTSLIVVDNSPYEPGRQEAYPNPLFAEVDDVWRMKINLGPPVRFAPALYALGARYVLFADDDLLPGSRALEIALHHAEVLGDAFATLSSIGRVFTLNAKAGARYSGKSTPSREAHICVPCDLTCQVHLVRADLIPHALIYRQLLLDRAATAAERATLHHLVSVHDDFLMCTGIQRATGWPSYVLPRDTHPERALVKERLPEGGALWKRPNHFAERSAMVELALATGWTRPIPQQVQPSVPPGRQREEL